MTINVKELINSLGKTYSSLFEAGQIPYKTKPKGDSGSPFLNLNMIKEGVILTFDRSTTSLIEIGLTLIEEGKTGYIFPNELPSPLKQDMSRVEVRAEFGEPKYFHPPFKIIKKKYGGVDCYELKKGSRNTMMLLHYNLEQKVTDITFKPVDGFEWKPLSPAQLL
ncbi:DUF6392 family protein [Aeromonas hydrophila]|uniref:DUF6392 family protein n=1 Tax=Aeromonas hydrophila TaxID=644 RepID=UPI0020B3C93D|nr:DUF6392 family protein [Aeromonas hydrophila]CAD7534683.1 hypothetical protein KBAHV27_23110 [Aeromonas hydrophila]